MKSIDRRRLLSAVEASGSDITLEAISVFSYLKILGH
jgi:hypothetical protein